MATIADMQAYNMLQRIGPMNEGLAMGKDIPPGKGGSPGQPYDPPKPTGPYVPAPPRPRIASSPQNHPRYPNTPYYNNYPEAGGNNQMFIRDKLIEDRGKEIFKLNTGIPLAMENVPNFQGGGHVTTNGGFINLNGDVFYYIDGILKPDGPYDRRRHGDAIPLANQGMKINPMVAKGQSPFTTPFYEDQDDLRKFRENADKILRGKKKNNKKV